MIPLARTFFHQGHTVAVATSEDMADVVVGAGLAWVPAGMNPRQTPELSDRSDPDYGYLTVRSKVDDLLELSLGAFRPDVIIRDPTDLAPIIASELVGAVNATYGLSRFIPRASWEILGADKTIARLRREFRLPPDPELNCMFSGLYLSVIPRLLEIQNPLPVEAVQQIAYVPWDVDLADAWLPPIPKQRDRPWVLVTLGTVYNSESDLFRRFLQALGGEDVDVLCALGDGADPEMVAGAPANVRFERYLPFSKVLPMCNAILCHGGFNTVMSALLAGVPPICVPLGSDHDYNAHICRKEGFGIWIDEENATPERLRDAVRTVIADRTYVENIRRFQASMAAVPGQFAAVRRIEQMVASRSSSRR
jgi:UDP:flavonoid glycosyltransferase YjiC (YdhE family)